MTHYTTISTLKNILEKRTIRFNRLDKVDDQTEKQIFQNSEIAKYSFVSCWTNSQNENIALWNMYSGNMEGVCIKLVQYPFSVYVDDYEPSSIRSILRISKRKPDTVFRCLPKRCYEIEEATCYSFDWIYIRCGKIIENSFLNRIVYEKDFFLNDIEPFYSYSFNGNSPYEFKDNRIIALKKHRDWSFQKEIRYRLHLNLIGTYVGWGDRQIASREEYIDYANEIPMENIDISIDEESFKDISFIWGPCAKKKDKEEMADYLNDQKLNIKYSDSLWTNKILRK